MIHPNLQLTLINNPKKLDFEKNKSGVLSQSKNCKIKQKLKTYGGRKKCVFYVWWRKIKIRKKVKHKGIESKFFKVYHLGQKGHSL